MPIEFNLKPKSTPIITYALIALNIVLFLIFYGLETSQAENLYEQFALIPAQFITGETPLSLISYMFLHAGWLHLGMNMYFLYIVGDNLEEALGKVKFLALYLASGIAAGLAHLFFDTSSTIYMIGASGAIAGLFAMYLLWFKHASLSFMFLFYQKKLTPRTFFMIWLGSTYLA